jgi:uncharacterized membrane protein YfcA
MIPLSGVEGLGEHALLLIAVPVLAAALGGLVHGTLGLGFPMVVTPLLALVTDVRSAILITLLPTMAVNLASIGRGGGWRATLSDYWPLVAMVPVGSVVGSWLLLRMDPTPFKLLLALLIVGYLAGDRLPTGRLAWIGRRPRLAFVVFGLGAGLLAGTVNVMVPFLIIYCLELQMPRHGTVQLLNSCFLAGKVSQMVALAALGSFGLPMAAATLPLALIALATLFVGMRVRDRIPGDTYRRWLRVVLAAMALLLAAQFVIEQLAG